MWVSWKMYQELRTPDPDPSSELGEGQTETHVKTLRQAVIQIIIADVSMSLDNVLAVAGAAHEHPIVLVFGLALSIVLMAVAATYIARLLQKHHWIGWLGLLIIVYVALKMIWDGGHEVWVATAGVI
jgi:YjbE family integral membrane protein